MYASPQQVFVVTEHNGTWGQAEEVPGLGALNTGAEAQISAVSCGAAGNCVAGGWYLSGSPTGSSTSVPFVVSQRNGRWGKAQQLPGLTGGVGEVNSVSCGAKDSCVAGGYFGRYHVRPVFNAFVAVQKGGRWDRALPVRMYEVSSVSCASAGNCTAADSTDFCRQPAPRPVGQAREDPRPDRRHSHRVTIVRRAGRLCRRRERQDRQR